MERFDKITLIHGDCMDYMRTLPDKAYDLAICDPPYGIGENWRKDPNSKFYKHKSSYNNKQIPDKEYFEQLFRVSKNQIIWGANYYTEHLPVRNSWIVWDKRRTEKTFSAEGELAWTSFNIPLRFARFLWNGCVTCEPRYGKHPHEKPVSLYRWLLKNYANAGDRILDTHLGSGSICIACQDGGFEMTGIELDGDYYAAARKRLIQHQAQIQLF
jgi:site-specific DNA-methyltransferase (adenine-specific)